jgi:hypothetical protein
VAAKKKPLLAENFSCFFVWRFSKDESRRSFIPKSNDAVTLAGAAADRRQPP